MTEEQYENNVALIAALRSGKYQQVTGVLRSSEGYCCLGVACDLVKARLGEEWVEEPSSRNSFMEERTILPLQVMALYGLQPEQFQGPPLGLPDDSHAAALNDAGHSFLEIAAAWERWLLTA